MNSSHLTAIIRMRWQMMRNQFSKTSEVNKIATAVLLFVAALGSLSSFVFAGGWGKIFLARIDPFYVIYVWDALAVAFLFFWASALMVELQRSELLSLKNLLHLPISLSGAFFLNYTSSLASLSVLMLLPPMCGLCLASVLCFGSKSLVSFALLVAFLLMVTAVSYQLRGWLARLMENKRTRGTVIATTTIAFVMLFQIPNFINLGNMNSHSSTRKEPWATHTKRLDQLTEQLKTREIDLEEYQASVKTAEEEFAAQQQANREAKFAAYNRIAKIANAALPIGWLPFGASAAARGEVVLPWLCVFGMSMIGGVSLALAYRSTFRVYTGEHNKDYRPIVRKRSKVLSKDSLLEKSIPGLTETQSAISTATFQSMLRAPEAKMALLTPLIFACVFGSMILTGPMGNLPAIARPWLGVGALGMSLLGMVQMMLNMFGFDRQGFRAYVLMPAPRRDILFGKNLGIFPIAGTLSALLIVFIGVFGKMQFTHIIATLLQVVLAFLVYFPISNYTSIVAPFGMATGTMRPVSMKFSVILIQFVAIFLIPISMVPAALALAADSLVSEFGGIHSIPIYLLLTLVELPIALWIYFKILDLQGSHLQKREQTILDVISKVSN